MLNKLVLVSNHKIVAHTTDSPAHVIVVEAALLKSNKKAIGAMQYKPSVDRNFRMTFYKKVQ